MIDKEFLPFNSKEIYQPNDRLPNCWYQVVSHIFRHLRVKLKRTICLPTLVKDVTSLRVLR